MILGDLDEFWYFVFLEELTHVIKVVVLTSMEVFTGFPIFSQYP